MVDSMRGDVVEEDELTSLWRWFPLAIEEDDTPLFVRWRFVVGLELNGCDDDD